MMSAFFVLASKLNIPIVFTEEWEERKRLINESYKLGFEGLRLYTKGRQTESGQAYTKGARMFHRANMHYQHKVIKELGVYAKIDWTNGEVTI